MKNQIGITSKMQSNMETIRRAGEEMAQKNKLDDDAKKAQIRSVELLEQIEKNTASLNDVVELLHESNLQQAQISDLMGDLFALAKAKDKKEAKSLYEKTIGKLSSFGEDVNNIAALVTLATSVYNMVDPYLH